MDTNIAREVYEVSCEPELLVTGHAEFGPVYFREDFVLTLITGPEPG